MRERLRRMLFWVITVYAAAATIELWLKEREIAQYRRMIPKSWKGDIGIATKHDA